MRWLTWTLLGVVQIGIQLGWGGAVAWAQAEESTEVTVIPGPTDEPTMDEISEARAQFAAGAEAAEEGRWSDALTAFRRSYELSGIAAALYNTATTYRSLGQYRMARDTFDQFLQEDVDDAMRESAEALRAEVAARVAALALVGLPSDTPPVEVRLDGRRQDDTGERPLTLDVDEGSHTVDVSREGYVPFTWSGRLTGGERTEVDVTMTERAGGGSNVGKIVLWVSIGVAVVAGGVALGLLLRDDGLQPESEFVVHLE